MKIITPRYILNNTQQDVVNLYSKYIDYIGTIEICLDVTYKVAGKVPSLFAIQHMPKQVMQMLSSMIHTFIYKRYHWIKYNSKYVFNTNRWIKDSIVNYTDKIQSIHIDFLHTAKNITARVDNILRVKYDFACNYCLEAYIIASTVLYKRYLDGATISLGLLFFF